MTHGAAYAVAVDMTARNVQDEAKRKGLPWTAAKGFDTFLPMSGPVAKAAVGDAGAAELFLEVNGRTRQRASTRLMLLSAGRVVAAASRVMTLQPGDIVLTGTPGGVGPVAPGDVMRAGLVVGGREVSAGRVEVRVEESPSYAYGET